MKFGRIHRRSSGASPAARASDGARLRIGKRAGAGFTLAEVLAALLFMAIVIPVAVEGVRVANLAGQVGQRKTVAARIAERTLNELLVTHAWQGASSGGVVREGTQDYQWQMRLDPWNQGILRELSVDVMFLVQGKEYDVRLSTLVDTTGQ